MLLFLHQTPRGVIFHCLTLLQYFEEKSNSLFILGKHRDFQNIGFCPIPQHTELSAKHRSRSKVWLPAKLSVKDLTLVLDRRLLYVRVAWHHLLCASQRVLELCFLHNTPSIWTQQAMNQMAPNLSNSLSPLYSVSLEFKLLSGWNYFFQEKWLLLFHLIHMQEILHWQDLSLPLKSLQRVLTNFCFLKTCPCTSHIKTWPPRWDISPPDNTAVKMGPLKCNHGMNLG